MLPRSIAQRRPIVALIQLMSAIVILRLLLVFRHPPTGGQVSDERRPAAIRLRIEPQLEPPFGDTPMVETVASETRASPADSATAAGHAARSAGAALTAPAAIAVQGNVFTPSTPPATLDRLVNTKEQARSAAPLPKRLGHVHRGGVYDTEMNAVAALLASRPVVPARRVVVGLTTTPMRIPHIRPVIEALLNQTYPCEIVVNIPFVMGNVRPHGWHGKPGVVPDWLISINPRVHVHRVEQDYGPATKLVGTMIWLERAGWDNSTMVVATDDDQEWQPYALASLIDHATRDPNHEQSAWSYYAYPRRIRDGDPKAVSVCVGQGGDMLAARAYHWRNLVTWGRELVDGADSHTMSGTTVAGGGRLPHCFFVDDMFFAAYLAHFGATTRMHPWSRDMRARLLERNASNTQSCRRACSPVRLRLRYPDSLAMGPPREKHTQACISELTELGWWPRGRPALLDRCRSGCC